jgi:threonine/homoserine/homoserine lactone efflux protein
VASSEIVQITAVAAGLAALFAAAPAAFTALRICGAGYLLYLGVGAYRSAKRAGKTVELAPRGAVSGRYTYLRGAVTNLVNPKMVTFAVAFLPQFVDRGLGHVPAQFAVLGAIFIALELLIDGAVGLAAGRLAGWLSRRRRARQALDIGSGTVMVALAGRLALER